jgi:predicted GNAT family N-acyltransferase
MRACEFILEQLTHIDQSNDGGSLEGYVVPSDKPQLENYLSGQGASKELIDRIRNEFKTIAILRNMYVDEEERGKGYGNDLVNNAIDDAANARADAIVLVADSAEQNAMNLVTWYENFGFEVIGDAAGDPVMLMTL